VLTLLLAVDGSPASDRAVNWVIKVYREVTPLRVHLLHVVLHEDGIDSRSTGPRAGSNQAPGNGERGLSSARGLLDDAHIPYVSDVRTGFVPSTIVEYGRLMECNGIVMGTRGMGSTDALLGSIARQVIHFSDVPVTLVKYMREVIRAHQCRIQTLFVEAQLPPADR